MDMNYMNLKDIFKEQKDFQKYFYNPDDISDEDKIKFTKEYVLSIHKELGEILDTIPWKLHRKEEKAKSENNTIEEIMDCFKFLLNLCIIWGIDDEKFVKEFFRKSMVVRQRYNQEILKVISKDDKVCAIDLDDTLADSSKYFIEVYHRENCTSTPYKNKADLKNRLDTLSYEEFKSWFRESGEKVNIPVISGAKELCDYLKKKGYKIVIISARPYEKHRRIFSDTLQWLNDNEIQYDAVYFDKDKHIKILKQLPNLSFIIEDNPEYSEQIASQGFKVYLLPNECDSSSEAKIRETLKNKENISQINNLLEIKNYE
jgi:dimeric dUTPase (all-alpha-NTP-PPase superfamily)